jgi:hypothetical protein
MSAEWVTAIATAGTFVVIAASAVAALIQLRHMRGSNQIAALTECRETLESPAFNAARRFVLYELPRRLADPVRWREATQTPFIGEYEVIPTVANFFETMGLFVKYRIIDERIACDAWSGVVLGSWQALLPIVTYLRATVGPELWNNFEYLAALSEDYQARSERTSTYPAKMKRMPEDPILLEREAAERVNA